MLHADPWTFVKVRSWSTPPSDTKYWRHLLLTLFDPCLPVGAAIFMATESGQTVELHGVAFLSHTRQVPTSFTEMFHFNAAVMGFNSATLSFITLQNGKVDLHCIGFDAICEREKVSTPSLVQYLQVFILFLELYNSVCSQPWPFPVLREVTGWIPCCFPWMTWSLMQLHPIALMRTKRATCFA